MIGFTVNMLAAIINIALGLTVFSYDPMPAFIFASVSVFMAIACLIHDIGTRR